MVGGQITQGKYPARFLILLQEKGHFTCKITPTKSQEDSYANMVSYTISNKQ